LNNPNLSSEQQQLLKENYNKKLEENFQQQPEQEFNLEGSVIKKTVRGGI